jgi:hypothetical protein
MMRLVGRIAGTLVAILVGVPVLVIGAADLGLEPRHWSGTRLSGVDLSATSGQECPPRSVSMRGTKYASADLEAMGVGIMRERLDPVVEGWVDPCHDRYQIVVVRLDHSTLAALSRYGDAVAVRLNPFMGRGAPTAAFGEAPVNQSAGLDRILPFWLSHEDPVGTWFTLLTGFPWYLGGGLAAVAAWWVFAVRRSRRGGRAAPHTTIEI